MKRTLVDRFRVWFGNLTLDLLEQLPKADRGPIAERQRIRIDQRAEAKEAYEKTRPPQETDVEYLYVRLIEMFHAEDAERLRAGLIRLLPGLEREPSHRDFLSHFRRHAMNIFSGGYWNLGVLVRSEGERLIGPMCPVLARLPEHVEFVQLWLHKVLPSVFVVSFDVRLKTEATESLIRLQSREHLSSVRFLRLFPWVQRELP